MRPTWGQLAMAVLLLAGSAASLKVPAILVHGTVAGAARPRVAIQAPSPGRARSSGCPAFRRPSRQCLVLPRRRNRLSWRQ